MIFKLLHFRVSSTEAVNLSTACLNTSLPFMHIFPESPVEDIPPFVHSMSTLPSEYKFVDMMPLLPISDFITTAPAPSPKSTQVDLSSQSTILDIISAPITNAYLILLLDFMSESATVTAYIKPEHAACTSKANAFLHFNLLCTIVAQLGKVLSGVVVATIIKSISSTEILAFSIALFAAFTARSDVSSPSSAICL
ncbi:hypothetical protein WwSim0461 [Wolbachia endosymbiont of Drosophila simulans]|nr:hypothetical protein WwSim0461 [Wolbachia endosymbiont of Drosophila simulans]